MSLINFAGGLSQMGASIADTAGQAGLQAQRAQLENQKLVLASQLAGQQYDVQAKRLALIPQAVSMDAYLKAIGHPGGLKDFGFDAAGAGGNGPGPAAGGARTAQSTSSDEGAAAPAPTTTTGGGNSAFPQGAPVVTPMGEKGRPMGVPLPPGWTPQQAAIAGPEALQKAWAEWAKPQNMREGSTLQYFNFQTGNMETLTRNPKMPEGTYYDAKTNSTVQINGALPAIQATKYAESSGTSQGALPAELRKIGAQGSQARETAGFQKGLDVATDLVPKYDPETKSTTMVTKSDALALARAGHGVTAPPEAGRPDPNANPKVGLQGDGSYKTPNGTVIPPAPIVPKRGGGFQAKPSAADEATQSTYAETIKGWEDAVEPSIMAEQRFQAMGDALKATNSGQWAQRSYDFAQLLGVPKLGGTSVAQAQIILKNNFGAALNVLSSTKGLTRFTQNELAASQKNLPSIGLQPEANAAIIAQSIGAARFQRSLAEDWNQAQQLGYSDPLTFRDAWVRANPIQGFIDQAKQELGPLKGQAAPPAPKVGVVQQGYRFKGGDPANPQSWEQVH